ncbi:MAG: cytochrome c3 family protein [Gemmatimonadota bacterium]
MAVRECTVPGLRRLNAPQLVLLVAMMSPAACGTEPLDGPDRATEEESPAAEAPAPEALASRASASPTRRWTERREVAEVDASFPHSEHRELECQRCHARPASHVTHRALECTGCHGRPEGFAELPVRTARECAACHHDPDRGMACTGCHRPDAGGARPVQVAIGRGEAGQARVRTLVFAHRRHAGQACIRCHTEPVTRAFEGDCSTCHAAHHTADSDCAACHRATGLAAHAGVRVHSGCAGSGCHADTRVLSLEPTRNVCLTCHEDLMDHHPERECTECHVGTLRSLGAPRSSS